MRSLKMCVQPTRHSSGHYFFLGIVLLAVARYFGTPAHTDFAAPRGDMATSNPVAAKSETVKHPVTVADVIRMTRIAGHDAIRAYGGALSERFTVFSPDRKQFVLVLKKGNLEQNTNQYSLLLYTTSRVFNADPPRTLVSFESSSNREAINDVTWLPDNQTILFLGEQPGETTQVYSVDGSTGNIRRLTHHPTNILEYSSSADGNELVYAAEKAPVEVATPVVLRNGLTVSDEWLSDLIAGRITYQGADVFVMEAGVGSEERLEIPLLVDNSPLNLSPDGRYLIVRTHVMEVPPAWRRYDDGLLQSVLRKRPPEGTPTEVQQYKLVDLRTGQIQILLDSPLTFSGSDVLWLPQSESVILSGVYLPLDVSDPNELAAREKTKFVLSVDVPSGRFREIAGKDFDIGNWDNANRVLRLETRAKTGLSRGEYEYFRKGTRGWSRVVPRSGSEGEIETEISVEQDLNTPPRIVARRPATGRRQILLDLNPQFGSLDLGKSQSIRWSDGEGHDVTGGLYLPPDYIPGKKYPLVIQTHGFDPNEFWMDGPFSTAFAAQPLAGKDMVVLQVPDSHDWAMRDTTQEAPRMMRIYERAIDYLDAQGVIDPKRVGLIGFSQTCFYVQYFLAHSRYPISAAVVADGIDAGYFSYIAFSNVNPYLKSVIEGLNGATPYAKGLLQWLERSPGFRLARVRTPLRMQAIEPSSLLEEWEWFMGLSDLKRPVELVYLPSGYHILQKPWDRMVSQQGDVDWFCFWLKGEEDDDPAKSQQYQRWRLMRDRTRLENSLSDRLPDEYDFIQPTIAGEVAHDRDFLFP